MHKNRLFLIVERIMDRCEENHRILYFLSISFSFIVALVFGFSQGWRYSENPLFDSPTTIFDYFIDSPFMIGLISGMIVMLIGYLLTVVLFSLVKRIKINKMEFEVSDQSRQEQLVRRRIHFISAMIADNLGTLNDIYQNHTRAEELFKTGQMPREIINYLATNYHDYIGNLLPNLYSEFYLVDGNDSAMDGKVKSLYASLKRNRHTKAIYKNRLINGENILVGLIDVSEGMEEETNSNENGDTGDEHILVVFKTDYKFPFETYDVDALQSIIAYTDILYGQLISVHYVDLDSGDKK